MFDEMKVMRNLMTGNALYGDIFVEERAYTHIQLESGRLEKLEKGEDRGVGLRVITPWKTFYASTNSFEENHLIDLASGLKRFTGNGIHLWRPCETHRKAQYAFKTAIDASNVDIEEKLAMVKGLETAIRKMETRIRQVRVIYRDTRQKIAVHTSSDGLVEDDRNQVVLNVFLVGEESGQMQTSYEALGGLYGFELFSEEILENLAVKTVKRLAGLLSAREAPMGRKTVVLASEAGGTMIHEAIGHGLEADLALEKLSCYKEMIGQKIASGLIDVVDDATLDHRRGTYAYDDEGVPAKRTILVEKGILKSYLYDRFQAMKHNMNSTGNGRRESFRHRPIPRMSNTMILPGKENPSKIIASVDDGIYVVKMGGGQVDTVRGDFVFEISEGYLIEKGAIGPMIRNATMMGNGLKVLQEIDMVGDDLGFGIGTCGKEGQGVPVADAQPTLRIPEIVVGGKE